MTWNTNSLLWIGGTSQEIANIGEEIGDTVDYIGIEDIDLYEIKSILIYERLIMESTISTNVLPFEEPEQILLSPYNVNLIISKIIMALGRPSACRDFMY